MRAILLAACVLGVARTVAAQDGEPRPFVSAEPAFRAITAGALGRDFAFGLDVTVGMRAWKGVQPIFQGGRLIDVAPADMIPQSFPPPFASSTNTWYGAAGARFLTPRVWRFQPYAEGTGGVAHMQSQVVAASLFTDTRVVPVLNLGAGAEFRIGEHFAIDAGYRKSSFFGSASVERRGPRLAFVVRF
jgi:hypothetical protein